MQGKSAAYALASKSFCFNFYASSNCSHAFRRYVGIEFFKPRHPKTFNIVHTDSQKIPLIDKLVG